MRLHARWIWSRTYAEIYSRWFFFGSVPRSLACLCAHARWFQSSTCGKRFDAIVISSDIYGVWRMLCRWVVGSWIVDTYRYSITYSAMTAKLMFAVAKYARRSERTRAAHRTENFRQFIFDTENYSVIRTQNQEISNTNGTLLIICIILFLYFVLPISFCMHIPKIQRWSRKCTLVTQIDGLWTCLWHFEWNEIFDVPLPGQQPCRAHISFTSLPLCTDQRIFVNFILVLSIALESLPFLGMQIL